MAEPAQQQVVEALQQLEVLGRHGAGYTGGLPRLPGPADDALLDHLAKGLQATHEGHGAEDETVRACHLARAVLELHAALALLQEWLVDEPGC